MKVIAIEEHMLPRDIVEAAGIDVQVLSALGYFVQDLEPAQSVRWSRELNDRLAATVAENRDRFQAFASLPVSDPAAAVDELTRSVEELGFVGAMIHGQTHGVFLDHPSVRPILAAAVRLGVPIYVHPAPPPQIVTDVYYSGLPHEISACLSTSGWGWHAECGAHLLRMVVAGVFEELPNLKIIAGHMGEGIPFHLDRIQDMLGPVVTGHSLSVSDTLRRNLYLTTSGYNYDAPLQCALATFGADHILFSVDHPFGNSEKATDYLKAAPLGAADREKIAHGNAESLLRL
jgi:predicted TIM-barrel fold metal-dependent hydrolase